MSATPVPPLARRSGPEDQSRPGLIARVWHARATQADFPAYLAHVSERIFPALQTIPGYAGGLVLEGREAVPENTETPALVDVQVITWWQSLDSIRAFAGEDGSRAIVEPAARAVLVEFDATVRHYSLRATGSAHTD